MQAVIIDLCFCLIAAMIIVNYRLIYTSASLAFVAFGSRKVTFKNILDSL